MYFFFSFKFKYWFNITDNPKEFEKHCTGISGETTKVKPGLPDALEGFHLSPLRQMVLNENHG